MSSNLIWGSVFQCLGFPPHHLQYWFWHTVYMLNNEFWLKYKFIYFLSTYLLGYCIGKTALSISALRNSSIFYIYRTIAEGSIYPCKNTLPMKPLRESISRRKKGKKRKLRFFIYFLCVYDCTFIRRSYAVKMMNDSLWGANFYIGLVSWREVVSKPTAQKSPLKLSNTTTTA